MCTCNACQRHEDRFWLLSPAQVFDMLEAAEQARAIRADIATRARAALDAADRAPFGSPEWEAAMDRWLATDMERDNAPIAAYLQPVKRWAGGPPELDAWYWDRPSY